jgi:hypothetical protein
LTGLGKTPKLGGAVGAAVVIGLCAAMRAPDGVKQLFLVKKAEKYAKFDREAVAAPVLGAGAEHGPANLVKNAK